MKDRDIPRLKKMSEDFVKGIHKVVVNCDGLSPASKDILKKVEGDAVEMRSMLRISSNLKCVHKCAQCQYKDDISEESSTCLLSGLPVTRDDYCSKYITKKETLCWNCANAIDGCEWSRASKPVEGWTAVKNYISSIGYMTGSYNVIDCPKFVKEDENSIEQKKTRVMRCKKGKR